MTLPIAGTCGRSAESRRQGLGSVRLEIADQREDDFHGELRVVG
jgi:hypothetical protein